MRLATGDDVEMESLIKARYEGKVFKPLKDVDLPEGHVVELKLHESETKKIFGIVKCWEGLEDAHESYESDFH